MRNEQAAQTRRRIQDAALDLFCSGGFARTSVKAIADAAEVSPDTIYATFGTKAALLTSLIDRALAPEGESSVLDTAEVRAVGQESSQRELLTRFCRSIAGISTRVRPVVAVIAGAALVDEDMAELRHTMEAHRLANMTRVAEWLAERGPLSVSTERAGQIIWAVASPEMGTMLCDQQGWTESEHANWIDGMLTSALLAGEAEGVRPAPARRRRRAL